MTSLRTLRALLRRSSSILVASLTALVPIGVASVYVQPTAAEQAADVAYGLPSLEEIDLTVTSLSAYEDILVGNIQQLESLGYGVDGVVKELGRRLAVNYHSSVPPMTLAQLDGVVDYTVRILGVHTRLSAAQIRKYLTDGLIEGLGEAPGFEKIVVQQHFVRAAVDDLNGDDFPGLGEVS